MNCAKPLLPMELLACTACTWNFVQEIYSLPESLQSWFMPCNVLLKAHYRARLRRRRQRELSELMLLTLRQCNRVVYTFLPFNC